MPTITNNDFQTALRGREVSLDALNTAHPTAQAKVRAADLDGDGKISGAKETAAAFKALDSLDKNGSRNSLGEAKGENRGVRAAQLMMRAAKPSTLATPGDKPSTPDATAAAQGGRASQVRADSTLGTYQGGVGGIKVAKDNGKAGAVQFKAGMNVDTDGGSSATSKSDKYYQGQTSMKFAGGKSLDADKLPFVVLPPALAKATGAKLGDLVEVQQNGKKAYAIYGDNGPGSKIGEASIQIARQFDKKASPNRAASGTFTYTVLPGSGAAAGIKPGGRAVNAAEIQAAGERAFEAARARGIVS